jgi:hypothetical protein
LEVSAGKVLMGQKVDPDKTVLFPAADFEV